MYFWYCRANFIGPPTFQPFDPVHYVIVGHSFVLNCTVSNDPQSPNDLTFRWYKGSIRGRRLNRINNNNQWNTTEHVINSTTINSQLIISDLKIADHSGTYICEVHNNDKAPSVKQRTIVVVESEFVSI